MGRGREGENEGTARTEGKKWGEGGTEGERDIFFVLIIFKNIIFNYTYN